MAAVPNVLTKRPKTDPQLTVPGPILLQSKWWFSPFSRIPPRCPWFKFSNEVIYLYIPRYSKRLLEQPVSLTADRLCDVISDDFASCNLILHSRSKHCVSWLYTMTARHDYLYILKSNGQLKENLGVKALAGF